MKRHQGKRSGAIGNVARTDADAEFRSPDKVWDTADYNGFATAMVRAEVAHASTNSAQPIRKRWLFHPVFDLILIANVLWPLLVWVGTSEGIARRDGLLFWQVYFITTPHRWITLFLVFGDRQRLTSKRWSFVGIGIVAILITLGVRLGTGGLTCLLAIDYLWNAWHFSAQHHGVARIYSRRNAGPFDERRWEKWAFRLFILYVIFRVAISAALPEEWVEDLRQIDWIVIAIPILLSIRSFQQVASWCDGGTVYRTSVFALFIGMLWAVHVNRPEMVLAFATASAMFHATEYLAIVGWSLQCKRNTDHSSLGLLGWIIPRWVSLMVIFIIALGAGGYWLDQRVQEAWLTINVAVAFLHYAYDGLIWRRNASVGGAK